LILDYDSAENDLEGAYGKEAEEVEIEEIQEVETRRSSAQEKDDEEGDEKEGKDGKAGTAARAFGFPAAITSGLASEFQHVRRQDRKSIKAHTLHRKSVLFEQSQYTQTDP
jgi:hypothetical protein